MSKNLVGSILGELKTTDRCIVVDFDGTLVGSEDLFWELLAKKLLDDYGVIFTDAHKDRYFGCSNDMMRNMIIEDNKGIALSDTFYDEVKDDYMETVRVEGVELNNKLIEYLTDEEVDVYILTNNVTVAVEELLDIEGLSSLIKKVFSAPDLGLVKKDVLEKFVGVYGLSNVEFHDDLPFNVKVSEELGIKTYFVKDVEWGLSNTKTVNGGM